MIAALTNHLWQSTLFVVACAIVAFALRNNGAHVRHRIWLIASLKFLVPFSLLMSLGSALAPAGPAPVAGIVPEVAPLSVAVNRLAQPFDGAIFNSPAPTAAAPRESDTNWTAILLAGTWACGLIAVVLARLRGWRRIRAAVRESAPVEFANVRGYADLKVRATCDLLEPGIVGIWRPLLLVPAGLDTQLTPAQLDAVIAHELCHIQRRDNLTAALHMVVEAIFWFHPFVWVVGAQLLEERERACDEHVLRVCGEPQTYAESILNVCKLYVESPVACVSGVSGADLKRRIAGIVNNRVGAQLNVTRRIALTTAAVLALVLPLVAGALIAPLRASAFAATQGATSAGSTFDVVSIKPCDPNTPPTIGGAPGRRGYPPWIPQTSPGYVVWTCATLSQLIDQAYADKDHPLLNTTRSPRPQSLQPKRIRGGPSWVEEDQFTIEAKMPVPGQRAGATPQALTVLPAAISQSLRRMLEDRFQLKVHRATEQQEMYALTIAKSGLNKTRMTVPTPGDCQSIEQYSAAAVKSPPMDVDPKICGRAFSGRDGTTPYMSFTLPQLAANLSGQMDLFVIDRTGVTDPFNFTLVLRGMEAGDERWISQLAELGLKIDRVRAPAEYLQIDSVQKVKPDLAAAVTLDARTPQQHAGPTFDVVSIKPCDPNTPPTIGGSPGRRGYPPWTPQTSPGYVVWTCATLSQLIDQAYADKDHSLLNMGPTRINVNPLQAPQPKRIRGGPSWVEEDKFTIEAKIPVDAGQPAGATTPRFLTEMPAAISQSLRTLLEDRFQLKVHRGTEQQEMYALTIAKSGLNKTRMTAPKPGDCQTIEQYSAAAAQAPPPMYVDPKICGRGFSSKDGMSFSSFPLKQLAQFLSGQMELFVLDRTGVTDLFNFTLVARSDVGTGDERWIGGVAELGLKMDRVKAPAEYLQIDRVQKPKPDLP